MAVYADFVSSLATKVHKVKVYVANVTMTSMTSSFSETFLSFFQIKVDIPPECRIYPIESEDEDEENRAVSRERVGTKEIICPWESLTPQNGTG